MSELQTKSPEEVYKVVNRLILGYKIITVMSGLVTLSVFGLYYYYKADITPYMMSGGIYLYILYGCIIRTARLKVLKVEVEILVQEYKSNSK